jgi:hypothetical protein
LSLFSVVMWDSYILLETNYYYYYYYYVIFIIIIIVVVIRVYSCVVCSYLYSP